MEYARNSNDAYNSKFSEIRTEINSIGQSINLLMHFQGKLRNTIILMVGSDEADNEMSENLNS